MKKIIISLTLFLNVILFPMHEVLADVTPVPLTTSNIDQTLQSSLSVNGFLALMNSSFGQNTFFKGIWRGKLFNGVETIFLGKASVSPKLITNTTIDSQFTTKNLSVAELAGSSNGLCSDVNGKLVKCPPESCYGGYVDQYAPGTYNLSFPGCPSTYIYVKLWGAGGGGGAGQYSTRATGNARGGGGGGAGGYAYNKILVQAGTTFTYVVGAGGNGGATDKGSGAKWGSSGGKSTLTTSAYYMEATGGIGGMDGWGNGTIPAGAGGSGGRGTGGSTNVTGQVGDNSLNLDYCGGGDGDAGGNGGKTYLELASLIPESYGIKASAQCTDNRDGKVGGAAREYGAGGGGGSGANPDAFGDNYGGAGGKGANGRVQIYW